MRIYIETDLEGAVGVFNMEMCREGDPLYDQAYVGLAADINAAVEGAFEAGADEVYVTDGHGSQGLNWDLIDKRVVHANYPVLFDFDAMVLLGNHAQAGTQNAFLDHTQSSATWFRYTVNGRPTGEIGQSAMDAAHHNAPVIFLSGDEAAVAEAHNFLGEIETVAVKRGVGRNRCVQYDYAESRRKIREGVKRAVEAFKADPKQFRIYAPTLPAIFELTFTRSDYCDQTMEYAHESERIDARTVRWIANDYTEIFPK